MQKAKLNSTVSALVIAVLLSGTFTVTTFAADSSAPTPPSFQTDDCTDKGGTCNTITKEIFEEKFIDSYKLGSAIHRYIMHENMAAINKDDIIYKILSNKCEKFSTTTNGNAKNITVCFIKEDDDGRTTGNQEADIVEKLQNGMTQQEIIKSLNLINYSDDEISNIKSARDYITNLYKLIHNTPKESDNTYKNGYYKNIVSIFDKGVSKGDHIWSRLVDVSTPFDTDATTNAAPHEPPKDTNQPLKQESAATPDQVRISEAPQNSAPELISPSNIKLRGYADQILPPHKYYGQSPEQDDAYDSAQGAAISASKKGGGSTSLADNYIGAIGYTLPFTEGDNHLGVTPYVAFDKESTASKGTKKFTSNFEDEGLVLSDFIKNVSVFKKDTDLEVSVRFDDLSDYMNNNRLQSANVKIAPYAEWLNKYHDNSCINSGCVSKANSSYIMDCFLRNTKAMAIFDIRVDDGWYVRKTTEMDKTTGMPNEDYLRVGGRLGGAVQYAGRFTINLTGYYNELAPISGANKLIGESVGIASWPINADKTISLSAAYRNGRREDTGQRDQSWSLGIQAKY